MRQPAGVLSSEEIARLKHEAEAELEGQRAVAQARKEKMLKVCHVIMPSSFTLSSFPSLDKVPSSFYTLQRWAAPYAKA